MESDVDIYRKSIAPLPRRNRDLELMVEAITTFAELLASGLDLVIAVARLVKPSRITSLSNYN
jgi:hypothetical protein